MCPFMWEPQEDRCAQSPTSQHFWCSVKLETGHSFCLRMVGTSQELSLLRHLDLHCRRLALLPNGIQVIASEVERQRWNFNVRYKTLSLKCWAVGGVVHIYSVYIWTPPATLISVFKTLLSHFWCLAILLLFAFFCLTVNTLQYRDSTPQFCKP